MLKYSFDYDEATAITTCTLYDSRKDKIFTGVAKCHPDDMDLNSKYTGSTIAEMRAQIAALRDVRDNEIIPEIRALKEYYAAINQSKRFNPEGYENNMLQRKIRQKETELSDIRKLIAAHSQELKDFILSKEKCYQGIRRNRAVAAHEQGQN